MRFGPAGIVFAVLTLGATAAAAPQTVDVRSRDRLMQAQQLTRDGRLGEAAALYRELLRANPGSAVIVRGYAGVLRQLGRFEEALTAYESGDAGQPQPRFIAERIALLQMLNRRPEAMDLCLKEIDREPSSGQFLGDEVVKLAEDPLLWERAYRELTDAFHRSPTEMRGQVLIEVCLLGERNDDAIRTMRELDRLSGARGERLFQFARRLGAMGELAAAFGIVEEVLSGRPGEAYERDVVLYRADLHEQMGRVAQAYAGLTAYAADNWKRRQGYSIQMRRAELLAGPLGRPREAIALYDTLLAEPQLRPKFEEIRLEKAEAQLELDELHGALESFRELCTTSRSEAVRERSRFLIGEIFFFNGELDSAAAAYGELIESFPAGELANDALDRIFLFNENFENEGEALHAMGRLAWLEARGRLADALALGDSLLTTYEGAPIHDDLLYDVGKLRADAGEPARAVDALEALYVRYPESKLAPRALKLKGEIHEGTLSDPATALTTFEYLLDRYPETIEAAEVRPHVSRLRKEPRS
jgi:tetratricopeptide (TPR) repeat protein